MSMWFSPSDILLLVLLFNFRYVQLDHNTKEISSPPCPLHLNRHWFTFGCSLLVIWIVPKQNFSGDPVRCCLPQFTRAWLLLWPFRQVQVPTAQNSTFFHPSCGSPNGYMRSHSSESGLQMNSGGLPDHHWS